MNLAVLTYSEFQRAQHWTQVIKVREAKKWRTRPGTPIRQQEYDWTWGTDYAGACYLQDVGVDQIKVMPKKRRVADVLLYHCGW